MQRTMRDPSPVRSRAAALALCVIAPALALPAMAAEITHNDPPRLHIGTAATADEIAARDIDIMPDGEGLPDGSGTVGEGRAVYESACLHCHGARGQGGSAVALAGGRAVTPSAMAADRSIAHTIGNYWPWATTLFDYTRRAMPYDRPGSLSNDEVYALTAYMLYLNGLLDSDARLDAESLPRVTMPARRYFRPDPRSEGLAP